MTTKRLFLLLLSLGVLLRTVLIWHAPLWYDENFTYLVSRLPFDRMIQATAGDVHPPLWYALLWPFYQLFPDLPLWFIRVPALVFSCLGLWLFWRLMERMEITDQVKLIALAIFAISPLQVYYAQEGRAYSLLLVLVLWAVISILDRAWVPFTIAAVLMVYTHTYGLIYCVVLAIVAVWLRRENWRGVLVSGLVTVLLFIPWALVMFQQMQTLGNGYWISDREPAAILYTLYRLVFFTSGKSTTELPAMFVGFSWLMLAIVYAIRRKQPVMLWLTFAPLGVAWLITLLWQPIILFRAFLPMTPFLCILLAQPLAAWKPRMQLYAAVFIVPLVLVRLQSIYVYSTDVKDLGNILATAEVIRDRWQPGDLIVHVGDGSYVTLTPILLATDYPSIHVPDCGWTLGRLSDQTRQALGVDVRYPEPGRRLWILYGETPLSPPCRPVQFAPLLEDASLVMVIEETDYQFSHLYLLDPSHAGLEQNCYYDLANELECH